MAAHRPRGSRSGSSRSPGGSTPGLRATGCRARARRSRRGTARPDVIELARCRMHARYAAGPPHRARKSDTAAKKRPAERAKAASTLGRSARSRRLRSSTIRGTLCGVPRARRRASGRAGASPRHEHGPGMPVEGRDRIRTRRAIRAVRARSPEGERLPTGRPPRAGTRNGSHRGRPRGRGDALATPPACWPRRTGDRSAATRALARGEDRRGARALQTVRKAAGPLL